MQMRTEVTAVGIFPVDDVDVVDIVDVHPVHNVHITAASTRPAAGTLPPRAGAAAV
jgi:hypothetical protein